jgi:hypothetical protein
MTAFDQADAPDIEPLAFEAGSLLQWNRHDLIDYDNTLFTLTYYARLAGSGQNKFTIAATAAPGGALAGFKVSVASAVTALYPAGTWMWTSFLTKIATGDRLQLGSGVWEIAPDSLTSQADPRSHARIMVDKLRSVIENRADSDVSNYAIGGRSITKMDPSELRQWLSFYQNEVAAEGPVTAGRNTLKTRFV